MDDSRATLATYDGSAFAPGVQAAAEAFFATWTGLAAESSAMAAGFADALGQVQWSYEATDESIEARFSRLDGRLGPER